MFALIRKVELISRLSNEGFLGINGHGLAIIKAGVHDLGAKPLIEQLEARNG